MGWIEDAARAAKSTYQRAWDLKSYEQGIIHGYDGDDPYNGQGGLPTDPDSAKAAYKVGHALGTETRRREGR